MLNAAQFCEDAKEKRAGTASPETAGISSAIVTVGCDLINRCKDEIALERAIGAICNMLILMPFVGRKAKFY